MKEQPRKDLVKLLLPLGFSSVMLAALLCGLSRAIRLEPRASSLAVAREGNCPGLLDCQPGASICEQAQNLALDFNPGFEEGSGDPWKPDHWYEVGPCPFSYDDPGPYSQVAAEIDASSPRSEDCRLVTTPIDGIPVEHGRFYDYSAWMQADLSQGDAYLRIVFFSCPDGSSDCEYERECHTTSVTDTHGKWVKVTGSVRAPATTTYTRAYARVEAVLPASSSGSAVWFDDVYLGLATCLDISKHDDPDPVARGHMLTYTIVYSNTGRERATHAQVIETYDRYVDFEWALPSPLTGTTTNWNIGDLLPNTSGMITVVVQVEKDTGEQCVLSNGVLVRSEEGVKPVYTTTTTTVDCSDGCAITRYLPTVEQPGKPDYPTNYDVILTNVGACDGMAYLTVTSSLGWNVIIMPSSPYTLTSGQEKRVTVSPVVPQDALNSIDVTLITATLVCTLPCSPMAMVTATVTTTVMAVPLTDVTINGPMTGTTNVPYTFTASVSPAMATLPITYHWWATEQREVVTTTDALSHTVRFTWSTPGTKAITVTATNGGDAVTDTLVITIIAPLSDIVISGPTTGLVHTTYTFIANVSPSTATLPVTYYWQATEQTPVITSVYALSHTVRFTWSTTGTKTIAVTATNAGGSASDTHFISIKWHRVYLPLVLRRWPPIPDTPVLNVISNADIDGTYTVSWNAVYLAITYTLQEDDNPSFSSPTVRYTDTLTSWNANDQAAGVYYYQVKANNGRWSSDWSNVESVSAWWEHEPNNSCSEANGPLISGKNYYGYHNDASDLFKVCLDANGQITMSLKNHSGTGVQLLLYDQSKKLMCDYDWSPPYEMTCTVSAGCYYVRIYTLAGYNTNKPYTLQVTFP